MQRRITTVVLLCLAAGCRGTGSGSGAAPEPVPASIDSPSEVLGQVATAHADAPTTATFTQVNTVTLTSGSIEQRQRVLIDAPDRMRVDNLPLSGRSGAIYVADRAISFANGRRAASATERNPFLLLGFGLYRQPAAVSRAALEALGISMTVMRETVYEGAPVWVIGAAPGDTTSNQVWIDSARWIPLRLIQSEQRGTRTVVSDTRFSGHAPPHPTVPRVIEVYRDGRRALRGELLDLRTGITVPAAAFDTTTLRAVTF